MFSEKINESSRDHSERIIFELKQSFLVLNKTYIRFNKTCKYTIFTCKGMNVYIYVYVYTHKHIYILYLENNN